MKAVTPLTPISKMVDVLVFFPPYKVHCLKSNNSS